jgi:hypothetical protein
VSRSLNCGRWPGYPHSARWLRSIFTKLAAPEQLTEAEAEAEVGPVTEFDPERCHTRG